MGRRIMAGALPAVAAGLLVICPAVAVTLDASARGDSPASHDEISINPRTRVRVKQERPVPTASAVPRVPPGSLQEPALARGYADGFRRGRGDGRDGGRYDPIRHQEYRDGDQGYSVSYGARDAYRNNYRAGFRQGYEEGYRDGTGKR